MSKFIQLCTRVPRHATETQLGEKHKKENKVYYRLMYSAFYPISKSVRALSLPHAHRDQTNIWVQKYTEILYIFHTVPGLIKF